ncbi:hypothetical protein C4569_01825 [Candidatus Parcubacteria bacterium]|nr:MAG: hypothetical protein C4569_01825 [Candidatus Parcubacteria bacterium]
MAKDLNIKIIQFFVLAVVLIGVFITVYSPHLYYDYYYPLHYDEWLNISEAKKINNDGFFESVFYPYFKQKIVRMNLVYGFDIFLAVLESISGNLIPVYQYLPAATAVLNAIILFWLAKTISKSFIFSLTVVIFFALLPSNINILGNWFFLPSTFSYFFVSAIILFFSRYLAEEDGKYFFLAVVFLTVLFLVYPLNAVFLLPVLYIAYILAGKKSPAKQFKLFSLFVISLVPFLLLFFALAFKVGLPHEQQSGNLFLIFKNAIVYNSRSQGLLLNDLYFMPPFFYYVLMVFSSVAIVKNYKNKMFYVLNLLFFWSLGNLLLFKMFNFTLLSSYHRILYLSFIVFCLLAPLGIKNTVELPGKMKKNIFAGKILKFMAAAAFIFYIVSSMGKNFFPSDNLKPVKLIDAKNSAMLEFIKENYSKRVVLAPQLLSVVIYPLTANFAASLANVPFFSLEKRGDYFFSAEKRMFNDINNYDPFSAFLMQSDESRKKILELYDFDLVYSPGRIDSQLLNPIFAQDGQFVYEVKK